MYNLPNLLTISRIVVIPVIFLSVFFHWLTMLAAVLFIVASITDYFDGYLARAYNQTSAFGRLLDPIADKLLVASALIVILAREEMVYNSFNFIPVIVILCREILVSGLREFLAEGRQLMPVTRLAKWKTGFQMTALSMILVGHIFQPLGVVLLWIAGVLTFWTGYLYFQKSLDYVKSVEGQKADKNKTEAVKTTQEIQKKVIKNQAKKAPAKKTTKTTKAGAKTKKTSK